MSVREELLARLDEAAEALGDELENLVLVGGTALALYPLRAGTALRPTVDVDWVVDATLVAFYRLQERLHSHGFSPVPAGPVCRFRRGALVLDVMPIDEETLGFTNRWYRKLVSTDTRFRLPSGRWSGPRVL